MEICVQSETVIVAGNRIDNQEFKFWTQLRVLNSVRTFFFKL